MARKKRKSELEEVELYKKIRKKMPPPERVIPDKRRKIEEEEVEREIERQRRKGGQ